MGKLLDSLLSGSSGTIGRLVVANVSVRTGMKSPYNQAMTSLLNAFKLDFVLDKVIPTYAEIEFARGSLLGAIPSELTSPVTLTLQIDWFDNSGGDPLRETDQLQVLFVADGEPRPTFMQNVEVRNKATIDIPLPPNYQGKTLHVWLAFQSADLTSVSLSTYAGSIIIT